jgi:hypothetical protein
MMPFQLFILTIIKKVQNPVVDPQTMEHKLRVETMMDEVHDKSNFMSM